MATFPLSYVPCHKTISLTRHGGARTNTGNHLSHNFKLNDGASTTMKLGQKANTTTMSATQNPKALPDPFQLGDIILNGYGYRQRFNVRSYEVQTQYIAIQTIFNLVEETGRNHAQMFWPHDAEFGVTRRMIKNKLRWVVSRMQFQVDEYPCWEDRIDIDTWVRASGKNGMRRDWEIKSPNTGKVLARATSTWVMVNQKTQGVWKMPNEVKEEISHLFIQKQAIKENCTKKLEKMDDNAKYVKSGLQAVGRNLDMNHHVRKMTYVGWMLEVIPDECLKNYELSNIILEFRRECEISDIVQSLCEPEEIGINEDGLSNEGSIGYTHLLQVKGKLKCEEMVRGKTTWKKRLNLTPSSGY